jgi:L-amino acid N-acyltransferase YncA
MPHTTKTHLFSFFGFVVWGDFAEMTMYRNQRGKIVWFQKTYPHQEASPDQLYYRAKLTTAAAEWQALTNDQRAEWELATKRGSLTMNGYHLWIHWRMTRDASAIQTLQRQTSTDLIPP